MSLAFLDPTQPHFLLTRAMSPAVHAVTPIISSAHSCSHWAHHTSIRPRRSTAKAMYCLFTPDPLPPTHLPWPPCLIVLLHHICLYQRASSTDSGQQKLHPHKCRCWAPSSLMQPVRIHVSFAHILQRAHSHRCSAQFPWGMSRPWSQTWSCKSFAAAAAKRLRTDMSSLLITFHKPIPLVKSCASVCLWIHWTGRATMCLKGIKRWYVYMVHWNPLSKKHLTE